MPEELLSQLGENGIMIIPLGPWSLQELLKITKDPNGRIRTQSIESVRFVEMIGKYGWSNPTSP